MDHVHAPKHLSPEELAHVGVDLVQAGVGAEQGGEVSVALLHDNVQHLTVGAVLAVGTNGGWKGGF